MTSNTNGRRGNGWASHHRLTASVSGRRDAAWPRRDADAYKLNEAIQASFSINISGKLEVGRKREAKKKINESTPSSKGLRRKSKWGLGERERERRYISRDLWRSFRRGAGIYIYNGRRWYRWASSSSSTAFFVLKSGGDAIFASAFAELNGVVLGGFGFPLLTSFLRVQHLSSDAVEHVFHVFVFLRRCLEHANRHLIRESLGVWVREKQETVVSSMRPCPAHIFFKTFLFHFYLLTFKHF